VCGAAPLLARARATPEAHTCAAFSSSSSSFFIASFLEWRAYTYTYTPTALVLYVKKP
jgi:hypothetical protein